MAEICSCATLMGNTGAPTCYKALTLAKGIFMVATYANDGTKNVISNSAVLNDAFIMAKISNVDQSKRWYPLQKLNAVVSERADPIVDTRSDGGQAFVKEGIRNFTFEIWEGGARFKKQLDKGRCREFSFFIINDGKLIAMDLTDSQIELTPIRIAKDSLVVKYLFADDSKNEKISVHIQFDQREYDGNLSYVSAKDDADLTGYKGLLDMYSTVTAITATGFTVNLFNKYGGVNDKLPDVGLLVANFTLFNVINSVNVAITSVTETADGQYVFVIPSTPAKTLRLTPIALGRDYAPVVANTFITP